VGSFEEPLPVLDSCQYPKFTFEQVGSHLEHFAMTISLAIRKYARKPQMSPLPSSQLVYLICTFTRVGWNTDTYLCTIHQLRRNRDRALHEANSLPHAN
jgi:hypothetical protein